jgi:FG-GAP-like repeat
MCKGFLRIELLFFCQTLQKILRGILFVKTMKKIIFAFVVVLSFSYCRNSPTATRQVNTTQPSNKSGTELAQIYCGNCHQYPEPNLLDKKTWTKELLPNMGARLGIKTLNYDPFAKMGEFDKMMIETENIYPKTPLINEEDWLKIVEFYKKEAPDSLICPPQYPKQNIQLLKGFIGRKSIATGISPLLTLTKIDELNKRLNIGLLDGRILTLATQKKDITTENSYTFSSPPVSLIRSNSEKWLVLGIGEIHPNEQFEGMLFQLDLKSKQTTTLLRNLKRPTFMAALDAQKDESGIAICEYGYQKGQLSFYKNGNKGWEGQSLSGMAGASKVIPHDFNKDGLMDLAVLMAQGNECINIYYAQKDGSFTEKQVLQFPPVYGSSDIQLLDFNKDGNTDLLYTNGDNEDFSPILKPYHGVRVFLNNGKDIFTEGVFLPMNGAFQARAADFDADGDMDIVVSSMFPSDKSKPEAHFLYLEQTQSFKFQPYTFKEATQGRWMTMDIGDADGDGDIDVLLGSFVISLAGNSNKTPKKDKILPFVYLENKLK